MDDIGVEWCTATEAPEPKLTTPWQTVVLCDRTLLHKSKRLGPRLRRCKTLEIDRQRIPGRHSVAAFGTLHANGELLDDEREQLIAENEALHQRQRRRGR